jgi:tripartite ATP-independent transporter DctP family solute receptor
MGSGLKYSKKFNLIKTTTVGANKCLYLAFGNGNETGAQNKFLREGFMKFPNPLWLAFLYAVCIWVPRAMAEVTELKLGHIDPKGSIYYLTTEEFARRVNEKLSGRVMIKVYRAGELGTEAEMLGQIERGETDMALLGQIMPSIAPEFGAFELPYIVLSRAHIKDIRQQLVGVYLQPALSQKGLRLLGLWETGFSHVTNNVRPISLPSDLKGLKIRVNPGSNEATIFRALGAVPQAVNLDAAYMLLKHGEIDAQHGPLIVIKNRRLSDVQKYLSLTRHTYLPAYLLIKEQKFAALDPEVRQILASTAEEMQDWALAEGEKLDATLIEGLSSKMTVNDVDLLAFVLASVPLYKDFTSKTPRGKELVKLLFDSSSLLATQRAERGN